MGCQCKQLLKPVKNFSFLPCFGLTRLPGTPSRRVPGTPTPLKNDFFKTKQNIANRVSPEASAIARQEFQFVLPFRPHLAPLDLLKGPRGLRKPTFLK